MKFIKLITLVVTSVAASSQTLAHGGIYLHSPNNSPALAWNNPSTGQLEAFPGVRMSNWNWHAPTGAFSTSSPSWSAKPRAGDLLGFTMLTSLERWNDSTGLFEDSIFNVRVTYSIGGNSFSATSHATAGSPGFTFAMAADGTPDFWHLRHSLDGVAQTDPNANGIYRMSYSVTRTFVTSVDDPTNMGVWAAGTTVTYPGFAMLFNRGVTDTAVQTRAFNYAVANPVPEPASLAALGLGAAAILRRRKRN